jgi:hypothetical protein
MKYSLEYAAALATVQAATRKFSIAQAAYRARRITDAEFLAEQRAYKIADDAFEAAAQAESANTDMIGQADDYMVQS